jgi:hypothetical protein
MKTGRSIRGLYNARYFRDGVIGIRGELHNTNLVYEDFSGASEVLFRGNEELMFARPQAIDSERIAFILARRGIRELWIFNYVTKELGRVDSADGNNNYWQYMRNLNVSEGKLLFAHNSNDRMYKLGVIDLDSMSAVFNERDFSGGVLNPVSSGDSVYYLGTFVSRNGLLRFPENASSLSGTQSALHLVNADIYTGTAQSARPESEPQTLSHNPSKVFFPIRYMNPFNFWLPVPLIRVSENYDMVIRLDGGGLFTIIGEPSDRNMIVAIAYADIRYQMAGIESLLWQNSSLGFPLTLEVTDIVTEGTYNDYRSTNINLTGSFNWGIGQWDNAISLSGGYSRAARFEEEKSAYFWKEAGNSFYLQTSAAFSYRRFLMRFSVTSRTDSFAPRVNAYARVNTDTRFPFTFSFFGAYDLGGMDIHGVSRNFGTMSTTDYALTEYSGPENFYIDWLAGGEITMGLFSFNIQKNISHTYFNRIFGFLSLRNQFYDSMGNKDAEGIAINDFRLIQSLMLRLGFKFSFFPYVKQPFYLEPHVMGAWKFTNTITGSSSWWYVNLGLTTSF